MEQITTILDRLSNNKTLFNIFGLLIAIDITLINGTHVGLYETIMLNRFDPQFWTFTCLGVLVFWAFNSLFARPLLLMMQFLLQYIFRNYEQEKNAENYTPIELLNDAINKNNAIAEKFYNDMVKKGKLIHEKKDVVFSLLVFICFNYFLENSLINRIPWESKIWTGIIICTLIGCIVFICIPYDPDYMDFSLKKKINKRDCFKDEGERLIC